MNGSAIPANNLNFRLAAMAIYVAIFATIDVPQALYAASGAVQYVASHAWDWKTGDNKPKS